jgi:FkbM family methyltransferase
MNDLLSKIKYQYHDFIFNFGIFPFKILIKYYFYSYFLGKKIVTVRIKTKELNKIQIKIRCRNGVDRKVLYYVFFQKFHIVNSINLKREDPVILDLGSNIGCTIIDLKLRYPGSVIFGYEMDVDNYNLAVANCRNFSDVHLFNKAVWTKKDMISYNKNDPSDAYSISAEPGHKSSKVACLTMADILKENKIEWIDFLKMDIEGAEINILKETDISWLNSVLAFNIEFHHIAAAELNEYIQLLTMKGFSVWKSKKHWNAIEGIKEQEGNGT